MKQTADGLNETQFHSLTAGGAYRTVIKHFLGYHCKPAALRVLTRGANSSGVKKVTVFAVHHSRINTFIYLKDV